MRRAHVADRAFMRVHVVGHCVVQCEALAQFDVVAYPVVFVMVMSRSLTMSAHGSDGHCHCRDDWPSFWLVLRLQRLACALEGSPTTERGSGNKGPGLFETRPKPSPIG